MVMHIAVVDAYPAFRLGLAAALAGAGYETAEYATLIDAVSHLELTSAVMVLRKTADLDDIRAARRTDPLLVIAVIQEDVRPQSLRMSFTAGASIVVRADTPIEELTRQLDLAHAGNTLIPTAALWGMLAGADIDPIDLGLAPRDHDWIRSLAQGATVHQLAIEVGYSEREMHRLLHELYERLGARNKAEALVRAARLGLVD
jgi:DNA-binding NarL/FixJ family response regulator